MEIRARWNTTQKTVRETTVATEVNRSVMVTSQGMTDHLKSQNHQELRECIFPLQHLWGRLSCWGHGKIRHKRPRVASRRRNWGHRLFLRTPHGKLVEGVFCRNLWHWKVVHVCLWPFLPMFWVPVLVVASLTSHVMVVTVVALCLSVPQEFEAFLKKATSSQKHKEMSPRFVWHGISDRFWLELISMDGQNWSCDHCKSMWHDWD